MPQRNTIEVIISAKDDASQVLRNIAGGLDSAGSGLQSAGVGLAAIFAPAVAGLAAATNAAITFEESLVNISAVTGILGDDLDTLSDQIMGIGENSRYGPQAVAEAFYDIAGGVVDASVRMSVLEAAVSTAQAGNADLAATTSALIGVMNSYKLSAEGAAFASDVLTQTVGMGVGTMDQFAAALPQVTGLANSLSIGFDELGGMAAYLTTQGNTASQAVTQLGAMMSALLNPNAKMREGLAALGFESGRAAVEALGLTGVYDQLAATFGIDALGPMIGQLEALRGVTALTGGDFNEFFDEFTAGLEGATNAAEAIQMESTAAQFDLLRSKMSAIAIEIGDALLPGLNRLVDNIMPVVDAVIAWVRANPDLVASLAGIVAGGAALGGVLGVVGTALRGLGTVVRVAGIALGVLTSPIGLVVAGAAALATVLGVDVVGGIEAVITQVGAFIGELGERGVGGAIREFFSTWEDGSSAISFLLEGFGMAREDAEALGEDVNVAANHILDFFDAIGSGVPAFDAFSELLLNILPRETAESIIDVAGDIRTGVENVFNGLVNFVRDTVIPGLQLMADWFVTTALPAALDFVKNTVAPAIQRFFDDLGKAWEKARPGLEALAAWFVEDALPAAVSFVKDTVIPGIRDFIDILEGAWIFVQASLESISDWFTTTGLPAAEEAISGAQTIWEGFQNALQNLWAAVLPYLQPIVDWFRDTFAYIGENYIQPVVDAIAGIVREAQRALDMLRQIGGGAPRVATSPSPLIPPITGIPGFRAEGGPVMAGQGYVVGERGPEVFVPRMSGTIIPNGAGGGGVSIGAGAVVVNVYGGDPVEVKQAVFDALVELAEEV